MLKGTYPKKPNLGSIGYGCILLFIAVLSGLGLYSCGTASTKISTQETYEAVTLPDGSLVLLNHHTTLSYHSDFEARTVWLEGEAYFDIVPAESDFQIHCEQGTIQVMGTEFNVRSSGEQLAVDVERGWVRLKTDFEESDVRKGARALYRDGEKVVKKAKSNREFKKWTRALKKEFKKIGRELKPVAKQLGNDAKKAGKKVGKELKKLKD